ncbi:unnamed protein product [Effrenium voratum]|uniref:Uncharacterized protein n=1 Tax=Effrenium voratum TaxID=2562239 RepID=A0AA36IXN3_9DINO|nr:unnamed protein product [Effrenium voratum]
MAVRVVKIECGRYSATLTAPGHGFPTGAQIQVKGIPELEGTLIVESSKINSFSICRDICVEVTSVDQASSTVVTASPHGLSALSEGVRLKGFDPDGDTPIDDWVHVKSGGIINDCTLQLEAWCKDCKKMMPAILPGRLIRGTVSCKQSPVVLPEACCGCGWASLVHCVPTPEKARLQDWQAAMQAAKSVGKVRKELQPAQAVFPDTSLLRVEQCGWDQCHGIFRRDGHLHFTMGPGVMSIAYIEELGLWCILAEVIPLHQLEEQRALLGLPDWHGPQLLYVRRENVLGRWEPVIGPAPGPVVTEHREVGVLQAAGAQPSPLLNPCVGSVVLDLLFNYTYADWRGGIGVRRLWGMSALETLLLILELWRNLKACSAACQTWSQALRPFQDLTQMIYHVFWIQKNQQVPVQLPSGREVAAAIRFAAVFWKDGLMITNHTDFQSRAWPGLVKEVCLKSELQADEDDFLQGPTGALLNQHAALFSQVARDMLHGVAVPWRTLPETRGGIKMGDGRRYSSCDLLDYVSDATASASLVNVCTDLEGHMELFSLEGTKLLPRSADILGPLVAAGLRPESTTRLWSSSQLSPKKPGDPCGFPLCGKSASPCRVCKHDTHGRNRLGASQLYCGYNLKFDLGGAQVDLEFKIQVLPFFATSKDASLVGDLDRLVPWHSDDEDSDFDSDDASASETMVRRRRLVGKQPPPACYRT